MRLFSNFWVALSVNCDIIRAIFAKNVFMKVFATPYLAFIKLVKACIVLNLLCVIFIFDDEPEVSGTGLRITLRIYFNKTMFVFEI